MATNLTNEEKMEKLIKELIAKDEGIASAEKVLREIEAKYNKYARQYARRRAIQINLINQITQIATNLKCFAFIRKK